MSWSDIFLLNESRGKETQQIDTSDPVFNTPSSTQALEINNSRQKKWKMTTRFRKLQFCVDWSIKDTLIPYCCPIGGKDLS